MSEAATETEDGAAGQVESAPAGPSTAEDLDAFLDAQASRAETYEVEISGLHFVLRRLGDMQAHIDLRAEASTKYRAIQAGGYPVPWKEWIKAGKPLAESAIVSCVYVSRCVVSPPISFTKALKMARVAAGMMGELTVLLLAPTSEDAAAEEAAIDEETVF